MVRSVHDVLPKLPEIQSDRDLLYFHYYRLWREEHDPDVFITAWRNGKGVTLIFARKALGIRFQKVFSVTATRTLDQTYEAARRWRSALPDQAFVAYIDGEYRMPFINRFTTSLGDRYQVGSNHSELSYKSFSTRLYKDAYSAAVQYLFDSIGAYYPPDLFGDVSESLISDAFIHGFRDRYGHDAGYKVQYYTDSGRRTTRSFTFRRYGALCFIEAERFRDAAHGLSYLSAEQVIKEQDTLFPKNYQRAGVAV